MSSTMPTMAHNGDSTHHQDHEIRCASLRTTSMAVSNAAVLGKLTPREGLPAIPGAPFWVPRPRDEDTAGPGLRLLALASITGVAVPVTGSVRAGR